jgi:hypothetical protein
MEPKTHWESSVSKVDWAISAKGTGKETHRKSLTCILCVKERTGHLPVKDTSHFDNSQSLTTYL